MRALALALLLALPLGTACGSSAPLSCDPCTDSSTCPASKTCRANYCVSGDEDPKRCPALTTGATAAGASSSASGSSDTGSSGSSGGSSAAASGSGSGSASVGASGSSSGASSAGSGSSSASGSSGASGAGSGSSSASGSSGGSAGSFGQTAPGVGFAIADANYKRASAFALSAPNATVVSLSAYVDGRGPGTGASQQMRAIIYDQDAGTPYQLRCLSGTFSVEADAGHSWVTLPFDGGCPLPEGTYFLGLHTGGATQVLRYGYNAVHNAEHVTTDTFSTGTNAIWVNDTLNDYEPVVYASYTY